MDFVIPWLNFTFVSRLAGVSVRKIYFLQSLADRLGGLIYGIVLICHFYFYGPSLGAKLTPKSPS